MTGAADGESSPRWSPDGKTIAFIAKRGTEPDAVKSRFGERGVVDLIGVMGYYHMVSMLLDVDRYPLPAGAKPELKPLP